MKTKKLIVCCDSKDANDSINEFIASRNQSIKAEELILLHLLEDLEKRIVILESQEKSVERGRVMVDDSIFSDCLNASGSDLKAFKKSEEYEVFKKIRNKIGNMEGNLKRLIELRRLLDAEKAHLLFTIEKATKSSVEFVICNNYEELKSIPKINEYYGLVVPCELTWANEGASSQRSEFLGITLVQHLREKGVTIPIVFTSVIYREAIVDIRKDADIIKTPALQHKFVGNPYNWRAIIDAFEGMRSLNDAELKYVQLLYCGLRGVLIKIKHSIGNGSNPDEYRDQIKYVLDHAFTNDKKLHAEFNKTDDLELFCQKLIKLMDHSDESEHQKEDNRDFLCTNTEGPIRIIYLEDNISDHNVANFIDFVDKKNKEVAEKGNGKYRFAPITIVTSADELEEKYRPYDVIIVDIDIKNKAGEVVALGFEVVRHLIEDLKALNYAYYIVTNVTRSFYDQIRIPGVKHIRLKEEVFGSDDRIERFLYGIKEAVDSKQTQTSDCQFVFNKLDAFVKNETNYDIQYNFKYMSEWRPLKSFDELEKLIQNETLVLIKHFLSTCAKLKKDYGDELDDGDVYDLYDDASRESQDYIGNKTTGRLGKGNGKLVSTVMDQIYDVPSQAIVNAFIVKLILRRYFLYIREFVRSNKIKEKGDMLYGNCGVTDNDLACRAVNGTKGAFKEYEKKGSHQSKCLTETLMLTEDTNVLDSLLTIEEKKYVEQIKKQSEAAFDYSSEKNIKKLQFGD